MRATILKLKETRDEMKAALDRLKTGPRKAGTQWGRIELVNCILMIEGIIKTVGLIESNELRMRNIGMEYRVGKEDLVTKAIAEVGLEDLE